MTDFPHERPRISAVDRWALALATALVVLTVAGVLPRILQ